MAISLALAACGGGGSAPKVASLGSTTTAAPAQSGSRSSTYKAALAYSSCMRSRGVPDFPDPNSSGEIISKGPPKSAQPSGNSGSGATGNSGSGSGNTPEVSADKACRHLLPNGGVMTPAEQQKALAQLLKFVQCMRSHGEPDFPDPKVSSGGITISLKANSVDAQSPRFQAAQKACRSLMPAGGPP